MAAHETNCGHRDYNHCSQGKFRGRGVAIGFVRKLSERRFWLSKWVVAGIVAGVIFIGGLALLLSQQLDFDTFLNYFALGLLLFVIVTLFYGIIAIHDVPYEIAKHRDHPHQDAIHAAGWVSLFTLHALWPFLWIWAMLYRPERGWGINTKSAEIVANLEGRIAALERRVNKAGEV